MPDLDIGIYIDAEALQWYFEDPKVECKYELMIN